MNQMTLEDFVSSMIVDRKTIKCYFICVNHHFRSYLHLRIVLLWKFNLSNRKSMFSIFLLSFITISTTLKRYMKPSSGNEAWFISFPFISLNTVQLLTLTNCFRILISTRSINYISIKPTFYQIFKRWSTITKSNCKDMEVFSHW
jgi:hypothetical protein